MKENDPILGEILSTKKVKDEHGKEYPLTSHTDENEKEFLRNIFRENNYSKTIEIGCAYGISSLIICSAIAAQPQKQHTIIDPFQRATWKNIGVLNLERAGYNFFELIEKRSEIALPQLLEAGREYDFGFIDGWHTFDHTLIDFFT